LKLFLDTANLDEVRSAAALGIIDGVTTNPSLIAREGNPTQEQIRRICGIVDGDVSAEVVSTDPDEMLVEAWNLSRIHPNVVVKVPLTRDGIRACSALTKRGVRVNVTLCFSAAQAILAAKAGAYIVSVFAGRVDDIGGDGAQLIEDIAGIYRNYGIATRVLAASLRGPKHVVAAAKAGAHIATVPLGLLHAMFDHPLTQKGLDRFLEDYAKVFQEAALVR
jgi:transaldolase